MKITNNEMNFYTALKTISKFYSPARLKRESNSEYGLDSDEAIEMAYENVISIAKKAIKNTRNKYEAINENHK